MYIRKKTNNKKENNKSKLTDSFFKHHPKAVKKIINRKMMRVIIKLFLKQDKIVGSRKLLHKI